ncbi:DUF3035 domain-containing protein [Falsiphaeobacter marinintestinus]|uniref:DUF3035 domain-containing protein n=1 Tax=Falsiphaeobacter marinintestinus TaxID=1492905 RepID=UPI0011B69A52|nr:DUF3035 domain-containing protein [Phaeobacter marinintestinus]
MRVPFGAVMAIAALAVTACGNKPLHNIRQTGDGPDEFSILPSKPLTAPKDYAFLPPPTPGGGNLTDRDPSSEAIIALGGRASTQSTTQIPSSDAALVTASSRHGVEPDVRDSLTQQDEEFRKRQGRLTAIKLFPVDRYEQVYRKQKLEPFSQADAFRRAGVATPSSPPEED